MKKIAILSPDTVPLPLKKDCPTTIKEGEKVVSTIDKCSRTTAPGKRSWRFAEYLSKQDDFDVTLLVPDLNLPPKEFIDDSQLNFNIQSYYYKAANWEWSEELDRKLKRHDFVILQTTTGTGFQNCAVLPRSTNVILDGWIPFLAELPCVLLSYHRIYRKVNWAKKYLPHYKDVLTRANCVLYANDRQHHHYEGQFFMTQKLDWSAFKFSPLLKVPYGVDVGPRIQRDATGDKLKLLWYGPVYPWYYPEILIDELANVGGVHIDFVGVRHPRYKKIYNSYYKKFFDKIQNTDNMTVTEEYCDDSTQLFSQYDAGVVLARNWIEERYSHRCRILGMASSGFPVLLNEGNALYEELEFLRPMLHPISLTNVKNDIISLANNKTQLEITDEQLDNVHNILNWDNVLAPLVDYIRRF